MHDALLSGLSEFIAKRIGLSFPKDRWRDLTRSVQAASHEFGFRDMKSCIEWLLSAPLTRREIEVLASHLTVGETYFFRDEKLFESLEQHVLLPLVDSRRDKGRILRIWSAGCASGEEPYSIAILLRKLIHDLNDWWITILATDINPYFLKKALHGVYSEWSFRNTPMWVREKYFTRIANGCWELLPEIRKMITFSHHNLAEDPYPSLYNNAGLMDIIVCRNVLMYFTPEQAKSVSQKFYHCLEYDGWLIVSPYEAPTTLFSEFEAVRLPDAILYRKGLPEPVKSTEHHEAMAVDSFKRSPWQYKVGKTAFHQHSAAMVTPLASNANRNGAGPDVGNTKSPAPPGPAIRKDGAELVELARHYANMGMIPEAVEYCERAISADKLNTSLHYLLATILQERGQIEEAVKSLKRVLYLDPDHVLAYFVLGNLTDIQGRHKDAEKHFRNAFALLSKFEREAILPGSDGMTAGRLIEIITSAGGKEQNERG